MKSLKKKVPTREEMEKNIHRLLEQEHFSAVLPDGNLDDRFILSYLIRNNVHAAKEHQKVLLAYEKIKQHVSYAKVMGFRKVTKKTLDSILLNYEALVRPIERNGDIMGGGIYIGEIIKLPVPKYDEGEEWKLSLQKEPRYQVGDKAFYYHKTNMVLDKEVLHLVSYFAGKILQ